jgi:hypothetical protein
LIVDPHAPQHCDRQRTRTSGFGPMAVIQPTLLPLGVLKAYLSESDARVRTEASHLFLQVAKELGYDRYQSVSRRVWRAEAVFAALLYPDRAEQAESLYTQTLKGGHGAPDDFRDLVHQVTAATDDWIQQVDWPGLDLVGFSISFCQVTASLYLISRIKKACPSLPVVVGGSSFSGERSAGLLKMIPRSIDSGGGGGGAPSSRTCEHLINPCRNHTVASRFPKGCFLSGSQPANRIGFARSAGLDRVARSGLR